MATGVSIPLRGLEGIPGLPGASQDEAVRTRKFEVSHGGGATCRSTSISRSTLEKNPLHGHLFEGNPVGEGTTRTGTATPVHHPQRPVGSTQCSTMGLRPPEQLERQAGFPSSDKTRPDSPVPTLQGPCGRSPKRRGSLRFLPPLEVRPSSIAPNPDESREAPPISTVSLNSQRHLDNLPEVTGSSPGNPGFPAATRERP